ncbi:MAG: ATP-binding protein [candidate division KSB1 bacterium]|nr:ATP-binding protein [candidate division KSB1 bacterium]
MTDILSRMDISIEQDVVAARQRARLLAELLGFDRNEQTRLSTAVSEIARNAFLYAGGGTVEYRLEKPAESWMLMVEIRDHGPGIKDVQGILEGRYTSKTGLGTGILGSRRLMDFFQIDSAPSRGTRVILGKRLPQMLNVDANLIKRISATLAAAAAQSPLEELRRQNQDLMRTLDELQRRQQEVEDSYRGVTALHAELEEKMQQLRDVNQLKTKFLSHVSHEFRTPINAVLALSQLLLDRTDGDLTPEQEKQVRYIHRAAEELTELVNDLLDLARIESGRIELRPRECTVEELFSGLRGMLRPLLGDKPVELIFELPAAMPTMILDPGKVTQILRNLISNAIKFTPQGEIRVSARIDRQNERVIFAVSDTGIGIAPEDQERIFLEYVQVEAAQKGAPRGTGLGLPICRKLAQLMGGSIEVQSELGKGSVFRVTLPLRLIVDATAAEAKKTEKKKPILIIEDDRAAQDAYARFFDESEFEIIQAYTLEEGRLCLQTRIPAAIILDILLPGSGEEDAWALLTEIKSKAATRRIPIIVVSVLEDADKGLQFGADDYCVKPVDPQWLNAKLRELAARRPVKKILIIDDEETARYLLKGHLAGGNFTVFEAENGGQGLSLAQSELPDVIFLDLLMPGMTGFEVLERLKGDAATASIPVIINTSKALDPEEREVLRQKTLAILNKSSVSRQAAISAVKEALKKIYYPMENHENG